MNIDASFIDLIAITFFSFFFFHSLMFIDVLDCSPAPIWCCSLFLCSVLVALVVACLLSCSLANLTVVNCTLFLLLLVDWLSAVLSFTQC